MGTENVRDWEAGRGARWLCDAVDLSSISGEAGPDPAFHPGCIPAQGLTA